MDAFFASVEQRDHPEWRGKPIAVGGSGQRSVVAAASYEARQYGVRSAMASAKARQLCPQLIFVPHRFEAYRAVSQQIRTIFYDYTDLVEPLSLDEAYLDVTNPKMGLPSASIIAEEIRRRIVDTTQLTASAGVSYCKFLAKMASDLNKPNGMAVILPHEADAFLRKLPVQKFHGIGKATAAKMHKMGIHTGGDLLPYSLLDLARHFGKAGRFYYNIIRGIDERPVCSQWVRKSISVENTFATDLATTDDMLAQLTDLAADLEERIRKADNPGRTLTLKLKYADFKTVTRSKSLNCDIALAADMMSLIPDLLADTDATTQKVRLLGLGVSNLRREEEQERLLGGEGFQLRFDF
jgi:DNA polymerase IV